MNRKKLFLWALYDFANSFVFINFLLYFSQWLVIDGGLSDFWYNAIFAIATVLLFCTAPILASYTDKHGGRMFFLNVSTLGIFIFYGLSLAVATFAPERMFMAALFFLLGQYFYQLAFVFYNPLLVEVADKEHRARASGIGQFSNAIGQATALLVSLLFVGSRLSPLLPALIVFAVLAIPMTIYFKEARAREKNNSVDKLQNETKNYFKQMISFFAVSVATPMLVAFFFFNDALITISNNYPIYMERVFAVADSTKSLVLIGALVMTAFGGMFGGWLGDRVGLLRALKLILVGWLILIPIMGLATTVPVLFILAMIMGVLLGSIWTVTRAYLCSILPEAEMSYGFSFYTLAERFATFFGPLTWGGVILVLGPEPNSYRIAVMSMAVFLVIGLVVIVRWRREVGVNVRVDSGKSNMI